MAEQHNIAAGVIRHQTEKLLYLLNVRGDQRPPDPKKPRFVLGEKSRIVKSQKTLAEALGVDEPVVSRWIAKTGHRDPAAIDHSIRKEICRIYKILESDFVSLTLGAFVRSCEGIKVDWHRMVAAAPSYSEAIVTEEPIGLRFPTVVGEGENDRVAVAVDTPFWMEFRSPRDDHLQHVWSGWDILLFNHDESLSAFACYLPRYVHNKAFAISRFPEKGGVLRLPRTPTLVHPNGDSGKNFEMVLVLSREAFPSQVVKVLQTAAWGIALEAVLADLAAWIDHLLQQRSAAIARAPYRVV